MTRGSTPPESSERGRSLRRLLSHVAVGIVGLVAGLALPFGGEPRAAPPPAAPPAGARVDAIGGVFFRSADPAALREWYGVHLGIAAAEWGGHAFTWRERARPDAIGYTVWSVFPETTSYFAPSEESFMINFRVADLARLLERLRGAGVEIVGEMEDHPNGRFAWILDLEGRKIELFEPVPHTEDPYLR